MFIGVHGPNALDITDNDLALYRISQCNAWKLFDYHTGEHVASIRAVRHDTHFLVRLADSRLPLPDGRYLGVDEYVTKLVESILRFYQLGIREFEVDNEPQFLWVTRDTFGPWNYQAFMREVIPKVRADVPIDVQLICPTLSFAPSLWRLGPQNPTHHTLDEWLAAFTWTNGGRVAPLFRLFNAVGAHPYWQSKRQMIDPSFGACFRVLHDKSGGMPVVCTEYGNSLNDKQPVPPVQEIEAARENQYPIWLHWVRTQFNYVLGAYVFILGGQGFEGFEVTEGVAHAIAQSA